MSENKSDRPVLDSLGNPFPHPTDSEDEVFYTWLNAAALGDVLSVHNLLSQCFNQMVSVKDALVSGLVNKTFQDEAEAKDTLKSVYPMLQRIETRIFKCRDRMKELNAPFTPISPTS